MAGGAPAGSSIDAGDDGWRTKRTRMRMMTMQGNRRTMPKGMEMDELPFIRIRCRKKAHFGEIRSLTYAKLGSDGAFETEGRRLTSLRARSMIARLKKRRLPVR